MSNPFTWVVTAHFRIAPIAMSTIAEPMVMGLGYPRGRRSTQPHGGVRRRPGVGRRGPGVRNDGGVRRFRVPPRLCPLTEQKRGRVGLGADGDVVLPARTARGRTAHSTARATGRPLTARATGAGAGAGAGALPPRLPQLALHVARHLALADRLALVVEVLAAGERDLDLGARARPAAEVDARRNERQPALVRAPHEAVDLGPVQKQLARPLRLVVLARG